MFLGLRFSRVSKIAHSEVIVLGPVVTCLLGFGFRLPVAWLPFAASLVPRFQPLHI